MKIKFWVILISLFGFLFSFQGVLARENVSDWYIQNFDSQITIGTDSSLDVIERITADCGMAPNKHGIFRVLPEQVNLIDGGKIKSPVELISIQDFLGRPLQYTQSRNWNDKTVTWKIGDPNQTVQGVNNYEIHYKVKNAVRFSQENFDELYWNLSGNFWDLEIDNFQVKLIFPPGINSENSQVFCYAGSLGDQQCNSATFAWSQPNVLEFFSTQTLAKRQGITASVTFPKNIIEPYQMSWFEFFSLYWYYLIPIVVLGVAFYFWFNFGKDPKIKKTVIAQYDPPGNLLPLEMGILERNGEMENKLVVGEIINLAVGGFLTIREVEEKILFLDLKTYQLERNSKAIENGNLSRSQSLILNKIFEKGSVVKLSSLKKEFYKVLQPLKKEVQKSLIEKKMLTRMGLKFKKYFTLIGVALILPSFYLIEKNLSLGISLILTAVIILIFSFIMPKRTNSGAELNWQIKGFRLFIKTVDKDRAEFYERENIFEKFLPYAIIFGLTRIWIQRFAEIFGEDYFRAHPLVWFSGADFSSLGALSDHMDSLSRAIASNTSTSSGSGGSGGAGGGGGGGGGGGW